MELKQIIRGPEHVVLDMQSRERWTAIEELIDRLVATSGIGKDCRDAIEAAVRQREETMSTGIGRGLGMPHAACPEVDEVTGVIGFSREGIEFAAMDGEKVRVVMLFVVPESQFDAHIETVAAIARRFSEPGCREALLEARDPEEVVRLLGGGAG